MKNIFILLTVIFALSSCDTTSSARYDNQMLVIGGYLVAGENIPPENPIFVGKTIETDGGSFTDIFLDNAQVIIIETASNDTFLLNFAIIFDEYENPVFGYNCPDITILPQHTYRIEVNAIIDSEPVFAWAETTVPEIVDIDMDYYNTADEQNGYAETYSDILPKIPYEEVDDNYPIYLALNSGESINTNYKFYCLEEFSTDLEFTEPFMDFTHLEEDDEEAYNSIMSNNLRETNILWRYKPQLDEDGNWFRLDDYYAGGFRYFARYKLTVYIVDENYYTFNYHSQSYLHGGINNGIGYFGSVTGKDFYTEIVK